LSDATAAINLIERPATGQAAGAILWRAADRADAASFLTDALEAICRGLGSDYASLAAPSGGDWACLAATDGRRAVPLELPHDLLDADEPRASGDWLACPLDRHSPARELLLAAVPEPRRAQDALADLAALAPVFRQSLAAVRLRQAQQARIVRLEAILEISQQWNATPEMAPLLTRMAEAACRLLRADRASIFVWDRHTRSLVGRPALGVEGNELRIPDNVGVVGQVIQSGQPRRVDASLGQEQIDRRVDQQLGYRTRTLLCVPLRGRGGELFGAFEMINKLEGNFSDDDLAALTELAAHAAIALENAQERQELVSTRRQMSEQAAQRVSLIGGSPAIEALRCTVTRIARTDLAVLVLGENGTGKEVVSQSIHYLSPRRDQPFIAVNCAAISETLLESELFGHERGAFTDAREARPGKFEVASGGTLFLDEIGDLSPGGQSKLLRVLEEKVVVRVGGSTPIHTDARIIAATNQNLAEMVRQKKFRQDLYFRLNVVTLELPPLRDRPEDIVLLAEHFLAEFARRARRKAPRLSPAARKRLETHSWPGNVRELTERLAFLLEGDAIDETDLGPLLASTGDGPAWVAPDLPLAEATDTFQIEHIRRAVGRARGNMSEAARLLGLHRSNLYRKMRQLGMQVEE
jgi:Nif-specific regulatory protein